MRLSQLGTSGRQSQRIVVGCSLRRRTPARQRINNSDLEPFVLRTLVVDSRNTSPDQAASFNSPPPPLLSLCCSFVRSLLLFFMAQKIWMKDLILLKVCLS